MRAGIGTSLGSGELDGTSLLSVLREPDSPAYGEYARLNQLNPLGDGWGCSQPGTCEFGTPKRLEKSNLKSISKTSEPVLQLKTSRGSGKPVGGNQTVRARLEQL